ncbi:MULTISPECIES: glycosyltransferase family 2 protein [Burkholderia]|uniref:Glycosyl transferase 2 family protein n=5 Tax=Burkholderia gladioli TaxID=28095 RepID=A0AAW7RJ80_BURGA|nr:MULTISPECIES: glycosyltransferase [Burkholderia]AJW96166.1 glycosyl transferase 2 family protein [Burkholderia gladioli]ASD84501.1 glycosyl transferase family 2 [Burkholderia gladioli pv. gladioli]ATF90325.1 glycosyl transferase family 2 [Burkholderia gladioli pv. gladioli]AWY52803.1 glycosyl transferase family 2 [Burkholderia gladioli pv. gladioli]KAF1058941.1 N-acetylglucosaminyl-diphospho-decaprenol L-rhamnosyltransferase [Burkholderia gladioli]
MIGLHDAEPIASPEPRPSPHEHVLARRALSILIVAHDSAEHIDAQLAMLAMAARYRDWQVIVVDNASSDGTAELVESRHPWALLIRSPVNIGYAAACNLAAREALGALLLLAHPDTHAQPAMIARAAARMLVNPGVGIAGGRLVDAEGQDVPASHRFPSALGDAFAWRGPVWPGAAARRVPLDPDLQPREPARRVDWVSDAFAIMRHDLFRFLGGFDPRFFMYCEDIDLCRRVAMEGFSVMYWPDVRALRAGRPGAARGDAAAEARHARWQMRSRLLYHHKHQGSTGAWIASRVESAWLTLAGWGYRCGGALPAADAGHRDALTRRAQVEDAWRATDGGRASPPGPWR